ncbi:glycoside hydrolase family 19 protein [Vibrio sp. 10N.286.51.E5]|uniref:glycoside hydrolase family 19 protein n=1 Tax=Vibrio sp. 10N.286.51.E5 TaxID=3229709 RepID=UPI0035523627
MKLSKIALALTVAIAAPVTAIATASVTHQNGGLGESNSFILLNENEIVKFSPLQDYFKGDKVVYDGKIYQAKWYVNNQNSTSPSLLPGDESDLTNQPWEYIGDYVEEPPFNEKNEVATIRTGAFLSDENSVLTATINLPSGEEYSVISRPLQNISLYSGHFLAEAINEAKIPGVKAGEYQENGKLEVIEYTGGRNIIYGPEGTTIDIDAVSSFGRIELDHLISSLPSVLIAEITTPNGAHVVRTGQLANVSLYSTHFLANAINEASIPGVEAGEYQKDGVVPVDYSGGRNAVFGPQGSHLIISSLEAIQQIKTDHIQTIVPANITAKLTTPDGSINYLEIPATSPVSTWSTHLVADAINALGIPGVLAGEAQQDGSIKVIDYTGGRNALWAPEGTELELSVDQEIVPDPNKIEIPRSKIELDLANAVTPKFLEAQHSVRTLSNSEVVLVSSGRQDNPENVKRVERIIGGDNGWEAIFPMRNAAYSYDNFLKSVAKFPGFCETYENLDSDAICKNLLATSFAHYVQETGANDSWSGVEEWQQGLYWLREIGFDEESRNGYNQECGSEMAWWECGKFPNGDTKSYFGRGAKQLSYYYNYGTFSKAMFGDERVLLDAPEKVADTWLNLASSLYFFMTPQSPKPSMADVVIGNWIPNEYDLKANIKGGFGTTTNIINGGLECRGDEESAASLHRIGYYKQFRDHFGMPEVEDESTLTCAGMNDFPTNGSGQVETYWEKGWFGEPKCHLVSYQTAYQGLFSNSSYDDCILENWENVVIVEDK